MTGASRQSRATLKLRLFSSRHPALDQRRDTRVGEIRDRAAGEEMFELRVFRLDSGEVRACVIPVDLAINHIMIDEMSEPEARAFLDGLALCEREDIPNLWVHDPHGLFPPRDRPVRQVR
jgi:hypothetical protein